MKAFTSLAGAAAASVSPGSIRSRPGHRGNPSGRQERMKTQKRIPEIIVPASVEELVAGLTLLAVYPALAVAERDVTEASGRLDRARTDVQQRHTRVEHLAHDVAAVGADATEYEQAHGARAAADDLIASYETILAQAQQRLAGARDAAREAAHAEARRRQAVLTEAGRVLLTELRKLDEVERALHQAAAKLPAVPYGPTFCPGSIRDQEEALRRGAA